MNDDNIYSEDLIYGDTVIFLYQLINDLEMINNIEDNTQKYIKLKNLIDELKNYT